LQREQDYFYVKIIKNNQTNKNIHTSTNKHIRTSNKPFATDRIGQSVAQSLGDAIFWKVQEEDAIRFQACIGQVLENEVKNSAGC